MGVAILAAIFALWSNRFIVADSKCRKAMAEIASGDGYDLSQRMNVAAVMKLRVLALHLTNCWQNPCDNRAGYYHLNAVRRDGKTSNL
ncbi:hypothetical protein O9992_25075 [Vibrio lentus]|nr:hypothetical protein [Vibrio lentus]